MKRKISYTHTAKTTEYLLALFYYPQFVRLLNPVNKDEVILKDWLLSKQADLSDEASTLPTIKALASILEMKNSKLATSLRTLYEDIHLLNQENSQSFSRPDEILCDVCFKYLGAIASFSISFKTLPRIDEHIDFYFIRPKIGGGGFFIKNIYHSITDKGQEISITASSEEPNAFLKMIKSKAYLEGEISFGEFIESETESDMQKNLLKLYKHL